MFSAEVTSVIKKIVVQQRPAQTKESAVTVVWDSVKLQTLKKPYVLDVLITVTNVVSMIHQPAQALKLDVDLDGIERRMLVMSHVILVH
jgi:hypothetical protein